MSRYCLRIRQSVVLKRGRFNYADCIIIRYIGTDFTDSSLTEKHRSPSARLKSDRNQFKIMPVPPPETQLSRSDSIGPPDPVSNIRPIQFYIPPDETLTERSFRLKRLEVLEWNKTFWADHNSRFFQDKEKYTLDNQTKDSDGNVQQLSPEEMSKFYRTFLNKNWNSHLNYNKEWYKKNISLLWPAFKVTIIRLRRKLTKTNI